jgi:phosphatidylserine decarboxylase
MEENRQDKDEVPGLGERLSVAGHEVFETIKRLIAAGNVRKVILWSESGKKLLEIPLTAGVALGGAALVLAPFAAAIAAIAGVAAKVRLEVIRDDEGGQG